MLDSSEAGVDVPVETAGEELVVDEAGTEAVGLAPGLLFPLSLEEAPAPALAPMPKLRFRRSITSPGRSP